MLRRFFYQTENHQDHHRCFPFWLPWIRSHPRVDTRTVSHKHYRDSHLSLQALKPQKKWMLLTIENHWEEVFFAMADFFSSVLSTRLACVLSNIVQRPFSRISIQYRSSCEHLWSGIPGLHNWYFESPDMETVSNNDFPLEQLCCEIWRQLKKNWANKSSLDIFELVCQCLMELSSLSVEIWEIVFLGLAVCRNSKIKPYTYVIVKDLRYQIQFFIFPFQDGILWENSAYH